ncbi:Wzz/FepE/Etk N-terminal domain-containing protein [Halomonas denitrificans]|uniref:Wzz/FepE/Etk N-terminal domain-containing protein n=1 Tax=Halomonas denitrificans TaxID=370769 RepID=UPI000D3D0B5F|nr:Wzz/FepE/Etk N-terminal domain-containing protein [Halomonas denitrificans]
MNAPAHYHPAHEQSDEIDLRDIAVAIYEGWMWIAISIFSCVAAGALYIFASTPQYSTDITFAPTPEGLHALDSVPGTSYQELEAFKELSQLLSSYENFKSYYEETPDSISLEKAGDRLHDDQLRQFFFDNIALSSPSDNNADSSRSISLNYRDSIDGPQLLNDYFKWTEDKYIQTLTERAKRTVDSAIEKNAATMAAHLASAKESAKARISRLREQDQIRIAELEDRLQAEKQSIISSREERIRVLQNAEQIASRLGIEKPTTPAAFGRQSANQDIIYAEINSQDGVPLYFMGTAALRAEKEVIEANLNEEVKTAEIREIEKQLQQLSNNQTIEALQEREDFSAFSEEYNDLKNQNEILASIVILEDELDIATTIHWAYQPRSPDSPRGTLIIALSLVLGGMLGVILLFISRFAISVKHYRKTSL